MDIVERLREGVNRHYGYGPAGLMNEAATDIEWLRGKLKTADDEIERLRDELQSIADVSERWTDSLVSQINEMAHKALGEKE